MFSELFVIIFNFLIMFNFLVVYYQFQGGMPAIYQSYNDIYVIGFSFLNN